MYVDEYLVAGPRNVCDDVHNWFSSTWQTTEIQHATAESPLRILGMQMKVVTKDEGQFDGYSVDQEGCIKETFHHHNIGEKQMSTIVAPKESMSLDPITIPEAYDEKDAKKTQSSTSE